MELLLDHEALQLRSENEAFLLLCAYWAENKYSFVDDGHDPMDAFDVLGKQVRFEHMSSPYLKNFVLCTSPVIDIAELRPRVERSLVLARAREKKQREDAEKEARKTARLAHARFYASCFPPARQREKAHEYMREHEEEDEPEEVALDPEAEPIKANRGLFCPDKLFASSCTLKFDDIMRLKQKGQRIIKWIGQADGYPMAVVYFREGKMDLLGARVMLMTIRQKEGEGEGEREQEKEERQGLMD